MRDNEVHTLHKNGMSFGLQKKPEPSDEHLSANGRQIFAVEQMDSAKR